MINPWNYIKNEIVDTYIGVKDPLYSDLITGFIILSTILILLFIIKTHLDIMKLRKERKERERRIDKLWLELIKGNDKNKDAKSWRK
jgi:hypothetical protein